LESFDNVDKRVKFYCGALGDAAGKFVRLCNSMKGGGGEGLKLDAAIRVYGINRTRDAAVAIALTNLVDPKGFGWSPRTGAPVVPFAHVVRYARRSLEHFGEDSRYKHVAYQAGLAYDILAMVKAKRGAADPQFAGVIDAAFDESLKAADAGYSILKASSSIALELFIVTACLLRGAARVAMAIVEPSYADLLRQFAANDTPVAFQHVLEEKRFGIHHGFVASLLCQALPGQSRAFLSSLWLDTPLFLQGEENKQRFDLASTCQKGFLRIKSPPAPAAPGAQARGKQGH
jgi:hypothetical protein